MSVDVAARERLVLNRLKESYEHQGFQFFIEPLPQMLPAFLQGFRPDAIALKPGENHIVEVKFGRSPGAERRLETVARLLSGHPEWQLKVFYESGRPEDLVRFSVPTARQVQEELAEAEQLARTGHAKAAFLLGWSVLEAIARTHAEHAGTASQRQYSPALTVQSLEMGGLIDAETGRDLRSKAQLRNLAAHGELGTGVEVGDAEDLLRLVRRLSEEVGADQVAAGR